MRIQNSLPPVAHRAVHTGERTAHEALREDKNFDTVTLQRANLSPETAFTLETVGRVTQEVRAATSTGDIQDLRTRIAAGQYQIDVDAIIRGILLK